MDADILDVVTEWGTRSVSDGVTGLYELADAEFSGAVTDGTTWAFVLNGRFVGVFDGDIEAFEDASLTAHTAPDISLPLLFAMQERGGEVRGQYYSNETPLTEIDDTLSSGNFVGYVELSENVLSGDYYVVYYGGRSLPVAFVGNNRRLLTGDEAFERAADEVGIYSVVDADIEVVDLPERPEPEPESESAPESESEPESEPKSEPESESEPKSEPEPESESDTGAEAATDRGGAARAEATPDAAAARSADVAGGGAEEREADTTTEADADEREVDTTEASAETGTTDWASPDVAVDSDASDGVDTSAEDGADTAGEEDGATADAETETAEASGGTATEEREESTDTTAETEPEEPTDGEATTDELDRLRRELDAVRTAKEEAEAARDRVASERDDYREEVDRLRDRVEHLEAEIERLEAETAASADAETEPERTLSPDEARSGTNLFVRYEDKADGTLERAAEGRISESELRENLRLDYHTEFETDGLRVDGRPFETFLRGTAEHRFATWLLTSVVYEIRRTDTRAELSKLYEAIERIDRIDLDGEVSLPTADAAGPDGDDADADARTVSFDVVFRDKMGDPLFVAAFQDSRDPTRAESIESLLERARSVSEAEPSLAAAFFVTTSFFDADAMEVAVDATRGGLFSRSSRRSYVKLSRKAGFHLCLVEARDDEFFLTVPEL